MALYAMFVFIAKCLCNTLKRYPEVCLATNYFPGCAQRRSKNGLLGAEGVHMSDKTGGLSALPALPALIYSN
ncbi:hypothetical protein F5Y09DRAFT_310134 [Xylaria sp. FL1042]|nr:hypothetical protein F5Y09DRAFT_310134 [Xylaria sp. FL1042]